jgi:hypothetical protein
MESGTIEVTRVRSVRGDARRAYKVLIDGHEVGRVRRGRSASFDIPVGGHSLALKTDWTGSPTVAVAVNPGRRLVFECGPRVNALTGAVPLVRSIRHRNTAIRLERTL